MHHRPPQASSHSARRPRITRSPGAGVAHSRVALAVCAGAALLALVVRLPHLAWGTPRIEEEALPMKKALEMWGFGHDGIVLNPHTAGWPSLSFYVHFLLQQMHWLIGR